MSGIAVPTLRAQGALPDRLMAFAERSHGRTAALLVLLCLACFLPGFATLQPMDRDEPRFAQATKQMLETGDYVDIRFQDEVRYKKPIGIHWLQAASVKAGEAMGLPQVRTAIAAYRVPSLAGAIASVLLVYWAALAFATRREAFLAAALVGASLILAVEARLAKTDAMLLACTVAAMGALARVWLARSLPRQPSRTVTIFWVAVAAGILIKGPMVLMFTGLAAAALSWRERSLRWLVGLRPFAGILFVLVVVAPWFVAIAWKSGGEFYRLAVGDDMLGKVVTGQQNHFGPPGYYLVAFWATFWPGAALAALALPFAWRQRWDDRVAFLIAWVVPSWLVFEAVPTKLPHYVMPLYPAIAILVALALSAGALGPSGRVARAIYGLVVVIPLGLAVGIGYGGWALDGVVPLAAVLVLLGATLVAAASWIAFSRGEVDRAAVTGIGASVLAGLGVLWLGQSTLPALKLSPRLAAAIGTATCPRPAVATLGYREPSLVFLVGTEVDMVPTADEAVAFLGLPGCRVALVESRFDGAFRAALVKAGMPAEPLASVAGFNINGGRRTRIDVYAGRR